MASQYNDGIEDEMEYAEIMNASFLNVFESENVCELLSFAKENQFFHWELEFPEVFAKGGFDICIGNPPYFNLKSNSLILHSDIYKAIGDRVTNIANIFINQMFKYLKMGNSVLGYIVPKSFYI